MDQIWSPDVIENLKDSEVGLYLEFSCTACIPGGGCNVEEALHILYKSNGDIKEAMQQLLVKHELARHSWSREEIAHFERLLNGHGKNFSLISQNLKTKTNKECVEFYYLWKKTVPKHAHSQPNDLNQQNSQLQQKSQQQLILQPKQSPAQESFPCKICGRVFEKIKSRSAHMKRHKNER